MSTKKLEKEDFKIKLQLFSEGDDPTPPQDPPANTGEGEGDGEQKTFTQEDIEKMKQDLEAGFNKKLEEAKQDGISEAERLAKLTEEERKEEQLNDLLEENKKYKQAEQQRELENEAIKCLEAEKLPLSFVNMALGADAEATKENIKVIKEVFTSEVQKEVENRLRGKSPNVGTGGGTEANVTEEIKKALKGGF